MKKIIVLFCFLMATSFVSIACEAKEVKTIYVATNGQDTWSGTKEKPLKTLKKAATKATAGMTIIIRKGTYKEPLIIQHSGTKQKPIRFQAAPHEKVVISGENVKSVNGEKALIHIKSKQYITVKGLTLQNVTTKKTNETPMGIYVTGSSRAIRLQQNHIHHIQTNAKNGNAHGIAVYGTGAMKDIRIQQNTVENLKLGASEAVVLNGNIDGFDISKNIVRRNDNIGIDVIGYEGVATNKKYDYVRNGTITANTVSNISSYGNPAYGKNYAAGGIYVDGAKNVRIANNRVYQNDLGIEATSEHRGKYAENITIEHNTIYHNRYTGISVGGYDVKRGGTKNSIIRLNTLYQNDTKNLYGGQLLLQHYVENNRIERNVMTPSRSRLFIVNDAKTNRKNLLKRNIYDQTDQKNGLWMWKTKEYDRFLDFQKATKSQDSLYTKVQYRNVKKQDFRLVKNSKVEKWIQ